MKIAVTGASGFVGKVLLPALSQSGHEVIPVERKTGYDITKWDTLSGLPQIDTVIHLAAQSYVPDAYEMPRAFYDTNVNGTLNMLEAARQRQAGFVFISSYVYGHPDYLPIDELHQVKAVNPYGQSKIIGEELCQAYARDFLMNVTVLRPFNIYGPGQKDQFLLPKIVKQALAGGKIELFDPRPKRDYVAVADFTRAIVAAIPQVGSGYSVYNIGNGVSYSISDIISILGPLVPYNLDVTYLHKYRPDEIMDTVCDSTKARELLRWQPQIPLAEGLLELIATLSKNN